MSEAGFGAMTVSGFLDAMGSKEPTPGGGAAAAIAGATGAALIAMVGRLTVGKAGFEDLDDRMQALVERADGARAEFLALGDQDAEAFGL
jgi:formiminotetrahydrofolate cyclodeaminase